MCDYIRPVPVSVRTLFHQDGIEFGKYGRRLGLIGEAVQPGNEAIKPWRQEKSDSGSAQSPNSEPAGTKTVVPAGASTSPSASLNRSDPSNTCHASSSER